MPLPYPKPEESQKDFIARAMGDDEMVSEYPDEKQRAAVAHSKWREKHGGKEPEKMAAIDPEQIRIGTEHEMEHTDKPMVARKIAMDHLKENPDYYKILKKAGLQIPQGKAKGWGRGQAKQEEHPHTHPEHPPKPNTPAPPSQPPAQNPPDYPPAPKPGECVQYMGHTICNEAGVFVVKGFAGMTRFATYEEAVSRIIRTEEKMSAIFHSKFNAESEDGDILKGVIVCEKGEAKGHGFYLNDKFLEDVVKLAGESPIKVRVDHPEDGKPGRLLSVCGEAINFRVDGDKVRADIKLFDVPAKKVILTLARQASNLFGMSIDFVGKMGKKLASGLREITCTTLNAVDFVESPAAATRLFHRKVDCKSINMTVNLPDEMVQKLGLKEGAAEVEVVAAIGNAINKSLQPSPKMSDNLEEKKEEVKAEFSLTELRKRMEAFRKHLAEQGAGDETMEAFDAMLADIPAEEKKEEKAEEKPDEKKAEEAKPHEGKETPAEEAKEEEVEEKEELGCEEKMEKKIQSIAAREVTRLLAKVGVGSSVKLSAPPAEEQAGLSAEAAAVAAKLGLDPKVYAENLKKANIKL